MDLRFVWDENKNQENIKKHQISFQRAAKLFELNNAISFDARISQGERRYALIAKNEEDIVIAIYALRNELIRIISSRLASRKERELWQRNQ